jgi:hypothetical protein
MDLQSLANLIHLRRYLYDVQNGYGTLSKEHLKGINLKIRELDSLIVKNALSESLTTTVTHSFSSSDADFEATSKRVLELHAVSKASAGIENVDGVTVASAPEDKVEEKPAEEEKPAPKKRKGAFSRSSEE